MNLSSIRCPPPPLVDTCTKWNAFSPHNPYPLISYFSSGVWVARPISRQNFRFSCKRSSFRGKREFGYWSPDGESSGGAKFKSRSPFEDDGFDDSDPWRSSFPDEESERDELDDDGEDASQLSWGSAAVQQALRSWTWILPAVLIPWLAGNPMGVIMALLFPLAQTAIGSVFQRTWKSILKSVAPPPPKPKRKRKTTAYRRGWNQSDAVYSDSFETASPGINREHFPTSNGAEMDASGNTPETQQKYSWADPDKSRTDGIKDGLNLGGWEDLDDGIERPIKSVKQKKKGKLSRKLRKREAPLFFRLLIALFPFLGFWGKYL